MTAKRLDAHVHPEAEPSATDEEGVQLASSGIGATVRFHRMNRQLRQSDIAEKSGMSVSFISQFERGLTDASVNTLTKVCNALGITVGQLFNSSSGESRVLRREDARHIDLLGATKVVYSRPAMAATDLYTVAFPIAGSTGDKRYVHDGQAELVLCTRGFVGVELNSVQHILRAGDSIDFPSETPHRIVNIGNEQAEVVWLITDQNEPFRNGA